MEKSDIVKVVNEAKSDSKKRKFKQSIDLAISLKDVNLKDPSKRFRSDVLVPHAVDEGVTVCVIGDDDTINKAKELGIEYTLSLKEIEEFAKNSNDAKAFISNIDYFVAIPQMMAPVGKNIGRYLGPAGKMPAVMPPNAPIDSFVGRYSRTVRIRLRTNPVINCKIANEGMSDDDIADNILALLTEIEKKLDNGYHNVRSVFIKSTMGPAKKLRVY